MSYALHKGMTPESHRQMIVELLDQMRLEYAVLENWLVYGNDGAGSLPNEEHRAVSEFLSALNIAIVRAAMAARKLDEMDA